jgi:hypothetical protein
LTVGADGTRAGEDIVRHPPGHGGLSQGGGVYGSYTDGGGNTVSGDTNSNGGYGHVVNASAPGDDDDRGDDDPGNDDKGKHTDKD